MTRVEADLVRACETIRPGRHIRLDHANAFRPMAALLEELGDVERARLHWKRAAKLYRSAGVDEGVRECDAHLSNLGDS